MRVEVFPAYAGMSPGVGIGDHARERFPRLRGDEPANHYRIKAKAVFSPPTRG